MTHCTLRRRAGRTETRAWIIGQKTAECHLSYTEIIGIARTVGDAATHETVII